MVLVCRESDAPGHETRARTRTRSNFTAVQRAAFDALGRRCVWDLSTLATDVLQTFLQTHRITKVCPASLNPLASQLAECAENPFVH